MASALTNLLGGSIVDGVAKIISLFKVDPTTALENRTEIEKIQLQMLSDAAAAVARQAEAQTQINLAEAQSKTLWVSGWRPGIGWACAAAFAYSYIVQPFLIFLVTISGHGSMVAQLPKLDFAGMEPVLLGMLGLGAMRSFDKSRPTDGGIGKASG